MVQDTNCEIDNRETTSSEEVVLTEDEPLQRIESVEEHSMRIKVYNMDDLMTSHLLARKTNHNTQTIRPKPSTIFANIESYGREEVHRLY
jgi:hypothetical protein